MSKNDNSQCNASESLIIRDAAQAVEQLEKMVARIDSQSVEPPNAKTNASVNPRTVGAIRLIELGEDANRLIEELVNRQKAALSNAIDHRNNDSSANN